MMKIARTILLILLLASAPAALLVAYPPVALAGLRAYAGYGSSDAVQQNTAFGAELDIDYRTAPLDTLFLAAWYHGELWLSPADLSPVDTNALGLRTGWRPGPVSLEVGAGTEFSSPLGDGAMRIAPNWDVELNIPLGERSDGLASYDGDYLYDEASDSDLIGHEGSVGIRFDPGIELGLRADLFGSLARFSEQSALDSAGAPTDQLRTDRGIGIQTGMEGILGFFTLWTVDLTGSLIRSNDNRLLAATAEVEEAFRNRSTVSLSSTLTSSLSARTSVSGWADVTGDIYDSRIALDSSGNPTAEITRSMRITGGLQGDWSPNGRLYLLGVVQGDYAVSNDADMNGWGISAELGVQFRF